MNKHFEKYKILSFFNPLVIKEPNNIEIENDFDRIIKFITIGRLSEEKGYIRILNSLSKIRDYDFTCTIVGSGLMDGVIKMKIDELKLVHRVNFIPYTKHVLDVLSDHDYFIQGSFVEGFPNGLLESCSVGTPAIAFNVPGGTKEIIEHKVNGFLINTESELDELLNDKRKLFKISRDKVIEVVFDKFNSEKIINQYEALFFNI